MNAHSFFDMDYHEVRKFINSKCMNIDAEQPEVSTIEELREKYPPTEFLVFRGQRDTDFFLGQSSDCQLPRRWHSEYRAARNMTMREKISVRNYCSEDAQALANIYTQPIIATVGNDIDRRSLSREY